MIQLETRLCDLLQIKYPIVQAGMAGATPVELVANVSNAGGLGTLGAAYMKPEEIRNTVQKIKQETNRPFAANLFCPNDKIEENLDTKPMENVLQSIGEKLNIEKEPIEFETPHMLEDQFNVLVEENVPVISTAFGLLSPEQMNVAKEKGIKIISMVTTVEEAILAEEADVDAIVAQGSDAGGHRSTFDIQKHPMGAMVGTFSLIPQVVENVRVPVIAAGGIMNGKGLVAALALGAAGVQLGTRFLTAKESSTHPLHKKALFNNKEDSTVITRNPSGRPARAIPNKLIKEIDQSGVSPLPFPIQNKATSHIRKVAAEQNNAEYMSLYAGQGLRLLKRESKASEVIDELIAEAKNIFR